MKNQISILALDLGSNLGWCRCSCILKPEIKLNVIDHGTIYLDQLTQDRMKKDHNDVFSRHRTRMIVYEEVIRKLIEVVKFDCYVTEDVFCMPNRISAFRSLALYLEIFERIVNTEKQKQLYTVPPTLIKKHISNYGLTDKALVQQAVLDHPAITIQKNTEMTHHESDSIAGAYAFVMSFLASAI